MIGVLQEMEWTGNRSRPEAVAAAPFGEKEAEGT